MIRLLTWFVFSLALFITCSGLSYQSNKMVDFGYPVWYELLQVDRHIDKYAPQNQHQKQDFHQTDKAQHLDLFAQLNNAVHEQPEILAQIQYQTPSNQNRLLTISEVIHLKDVNILIRNLTSLWWFALIVVVVLTPIYWRGSLSFPPTKWQLAFFSTLSAVTLLSYFTFGFDKLYAFLHESVFPENHQWFFYYQESLMTTFLKAPDLFAAFGAQISLIAMALFLLVYMILAKKMGQRVKSSRLM
ncbi:DUF1461 domain-containing protein [Thalassotalea aquiviva]|uniref:lipoprotein intramolecular transacylase Lit n=1 Tax=Thalassotalea aquiviva TaxID=3242415 RepID=UPI00352A8749